MDEHVTKADIVEMQLENHEAVCAERYKRIDEKLESLDDGFDKMQNLLIKVAFGGVGGMFTILLMLAGVLMK